MGATLQAAPKPTVVTDASACGFPAFLSTVNGSTKGWMFAPPYVGLKWVELNGVLLLGNTATNDPTSGLAFTSPALPYPVEGFDWTGAPQRPARNGLCRGGIHGNRQAFGLKLNATAGRRYLVEVLALGAAAAKRSFSVVADGQTVVKDWTILRDQAANRVLRFEIEAGADGLDLQFMPGTVPGTDTNPALTAIALTDLSEPLRRTDPDGTVTLVGLENIAGLGTASSPDGLEQDGDGRGDYAAIDGNPESWWDEQDGARLYRLVVNFPSPEKICAISIVGYAQHDFSPKDFEILGDGKPLKKVTNARYLGNFLEVFFPETACQSVELKITGYYGRSPAIRELGIYRRLAAPSPASDSPLRMEPVSATEWTVRHQDQPLLSYNFNPNLKKPYVRKLHTVRGDNLLRDSPADHRHHHALMYAVRVNGINFWEETPGCGVQKPAKILRQSVDVGAGGLPQATFSQRLLWVPETNAATATEKDALLLEDRTITVTVDQKAGEVALQWHAEFQAGPAAGAQIKLEGANYFGLGMRFLAELDPLAIHQLGERRLDLPGTTQDISKAPFGAVLFASPERPATVAIFGATGNARGEPVFFSMKRAFAYLAATQGLDKEPIVYPAGQKWTLDYLVTLNPAVLPAAYFKERAARWALENRK